MKYVSIFLLLFSLHALAKDHPLIYLENSGPGKVFCHCVHLKKNIYLTAAHCVKNFEKETISLSGNEIKSILYHKKYLFMFPTDQLDFAVVKSKSSIVTQPIKDASIGDRIRIGNLNGVVTEVYQSEFRVKFNKKAPCYSDSGKGAYIGDKLIGILSRGHKECIDFAIFTKATSIVEWLKNPKSIKKYLTQERKNILITELKKKLRLKNDKGN